MKLSDDGFTLVLSSGRTLYAGTGMLSIEWADEDQSDLPFYGHVGQVWSATRSGHTPGLAEYPLTDAERGEIATTMIEAWARWGKVALRAPAVTGGEPTS